MHEQLAAVDEIAAALCGSAAAVSIPAEASAEVLRNRTHHQQDKPPSSHHYALALLVRPDLADVHGVVAALLKPGPMPYRGYSATEWLESKAAFVA